MEPKVTRLDGVRAFHAGRKAGQAGRPVSACPYDAAGDTAEQWKTKAWLTGRRAGAEG